MKNALTHAPAIENEPILAYAPGSSERALQESALNRIAEEQAELPVIIAGKEIRTGQTTDVVMPHDHQHVIGKTHHAGAAEVENAIEAALKIAPAWRRMSFDDRAAIFLRAADMLASPRWRHRMNAACMLGQSKTVFQAEIDSACELIDFLRFNVKFAEEILSGQPISDPGLWNRSEYRPLEGFVLAITPFNFLAIAVNLPAAPALMGNVVLWKPSHQTGVGVAHALELLKEAGLPDGVINVIPGDGPEQGKVALASEHLAGIHFTGSTNTFRSLWKAAANNLENYRTIPRIVGETGGKDFIVAHPSADIEALSVAMARGGFEYQGQKCSAASRCYVPKSMWPEIKERVVAAINDMKVGDVRDFSNFLGAVIDERAFDKIVNYIEIAKNEANIVTGGGCDKSKGYFIDPTLVEVSDPKHKLMQEEIFGPVLTTYVYDDAKFEEVLALTDATSPYALTGSIFANDRQVVAHASERLVNAAGNFYINDKPTGAVVGQQPFGGARASGTNDKAGSTLNLLRWVSPRSIKENLNPPKDWRYPFMA